MRFTIVTPVLNGERYIRKTIESVLNQKYSNFEYIIVDGLSSDNTIRIIREYSHYSFLKLISEKDRGQADAINKGFSMASGDILFWINYDDFFYDENVLLRIHKLFHNNDYDFIYGNDLLVDESGTILKKRVFRNMSLKKLIYLKSLSQPTCFFKKDLFNKYKLRNDLNFSMDLNLWINFMKDSHIRIYYEDSIIACNRIHNQRKMIKFESEAREEALKIRLSIFEDNIFTYRLKNYFYRFLDFIL